MGSIADINTGSTVVQTGLGIVATFVGAFEDVFGTILEAVGSTGDN